MTALDSFAVKPSYKVTLKFFSILSLPTLPSWIPNERKAKTKDLVRDIKEIATVLLEKENAK